jgi:hypothetical protein
VAQPTAATQVAHPDHQLGLEPTGVALAQRRYAEPGDALAQRLALRRLEGETGSASVAQPSPFLALAREQRHRRAAALI